MQIHKYCPECNSELKQYIEYDEKDCVLYCKECGLVLAATIEYVGGNKIYLPWGLL